MRTRPPATRTRSTCVRLVLAAAVAASLGALAACSSGNDPHSDASGFVTQTDFRPGGVAPPCLLHQTEQPGPAVQGGSGSQPTPQLTFLAYYTALGNGQFCDGQPANSVDKQWAQLYTQLTQQPGKVRTVTG